MADYGSLIADKAIKQTSVKLRGLYLDAAKRIQKVINSYTNRFKAQQEIKLAQLEAGEITREAYGSWLRGQVFIGQQWNRKMDQAITIMQEANGAAVDIVTKHKFNVFAENYNYSAYKLEKWAKGAVNFSVFNDKAVAKLVKQNPKMLPEWKIDKRKDYSWNRKKVENTITQGIIQGKKINEISTDLANNLCTQNNNKMTTFARTAMTGAQNAGRQELMEEAEEEGIKVKKRWVATLDDRTRDTHAELDGQEVPVDEPFEVDGMEIMYPGDPDAEPELVYNCRCTMIEVYEGIDRTSRRRDMDNNIVENMTYKEWKAMKEEDGE